jgi:hypothetical protein
LKYWTQPIKIEIPKKKIDLAKEFAKAVVETTNYSDSNQYKKEKIEFDHFISKIGEEAVCKIFKNFTDSVTEPDYTIYMGNYKSWDSDLKVQNTTIAVKTQANSNAEKYGLSWTFQSSPNRTDPILNSKDAWVCFVECYDDNEYKCKVFPPRQINELHFSEPKLDHLKGKKKVVYAKDNFPD